MDAQAILKLLQASLPQILGISLGDLNDPDTWRFDSKEPLSKDEYAIAVSVVQTALIPTTPIILPAMPSTSDLDNIIRWGGKHFGQTLKEAQDEIAQLAQPIIVVPPDPPPDPLGTGG